MVLDLKQIFDLPGEELAFDCELDLADYELFGVRPFVTPVSIKGKVSNESGIVTLRYTAGFSMRIPCDRCLEDFDRDELFSFEEILVTEESPSHDEYIAVEDMRLDIGELCIADILLSLPTKQLCREDCAGLCPVCGGNRNFVNCNCQQKEADPRLAALGKLLD